ncbi:MAG: SMEK domain-containing protein [Bacteroidota bacterium]
MLTKLDYIGKITDTYALLETSFRNRILLNLYDSNIISEDFFAGLLNIIYDLNLQNINNIKKNSPSVDLVDEFNKIAYQVTSTNTQVKVQKTINSFLKHKLNKQFDTLKILLLKSKLPKYSAFTNGNQVNFTEKNIIEFNDLIVDIKSLNITKLQNICDFLSKEVKYYNELNSLISQTDSKAISNYKSLIKRKALLDTFYLEGSMHDFEEALREINKAFSTGLIKQGLEVKPIHQFKDSNTKDNLETIQFKFQELHRLYKLYVKTGEINPNNSGFFPKNQIQTISVFDNFREDILISFNAILQQYNEREIDFNFKKYGY